MIVIQLTIGYMEPASAATSDTSYVSLTKANIGQDVVDEEIEEVGGEKTKIRLKDRL